MKKMNLKNIVRVFFLAILILAAGCDYENMQENGILEGTISIGPICPAEKFPPDPDCLLTAETYKAYPVYEYSSNGSKKLN